MQILFEQKQFSLGVLCTGIRWGGNCFVECKFTADNPKDILKIKGEVSLKVTYSGVTVEGTVGAEYEQSKTSSKTEFELVWYR